MVHTYISPKEHAPEQVCVLLAAVITVAGPLIRVVCTVGETITDPVIGDAVINPIATMTQEQLWVGAVVTPVRQFIVISGDCTD